MAFRAYPAASGGWDAPVEPDADEAPLVFASVEVGNALNVDLLADDCWRLAIHNIVVVECHVVHDAVAGWHDLCDSSCPSAYQVRLKQGWTGGTAGERE